MDAQEKARGRVVISDRKSIVLDGVDNVLSFDEGYVSISTSLGEANIEGEGLKIESLSKEKGEISVCGRISAFYYKDKASKKKKAF